MNLTDQTRNRSIPPNPSAVADIQPRGALARAVRLGVLLSLLVSPLLALAQASPFETGATALQTNLLTIMTPIAIILIVVLGIAAMVNRISWGWAAAAVAGIAIAFGAPQMVAWVRGMFGV